MKKIAMVLLAVLLSLSLAACGAPAAPAPESQAPAGSESSESSAPSSQAEESDSSTELRGNPEPQWLAKFEAEDFAWQQAGKGDEANKFNIEGDRTIGERSYYLMRGYRDTPENTFGWFLVDVETGETFGANEDKDGLVPLDEMKY